MCLNRLAKFINLIVHLFELVLLFCFQCFTVHCINPTLYLLHMLILLVFQLECFSHTCQTFAITDASIWSASSNINSATASISPYQKSSVPIPTNKPPYWLGQKNVGFLPVTKLSISSLKTIVKVASVLYSISPPNTISSSDNSINSSYYPRRDPCFLKLCLHHIWNLWF